METLANSTLDTPEQFSVNSAPSEALEDQRKTKHHKPTTASLEETHPLRSLFHTNATTAEELRTELLHDLRRRAAAEEVYRAGMARTIKERAVLDGRLRLLADLALFWSEIVIDKKEETQP